MTVLGGGFHKGVPLAGGGSSSHTQAHTLHTHAHPRTRTRPLTRTWRYVHTLTPEAGAERGPCAGRGRQESAGGQQRGHCVPMTQLVRAVKASQPPGRSRARGRPQHRPRPRATASRARHRAERSHGAAKPDPTQVATAAPSVRAGTQARCPGGPVGERQQGPDGGAHSCSGGGQRISSPGTLLLSAPPQEPAADSEAVKTHPLGFFPRMSRPRLLRVGLAL